MKNNVHFKTGMLQAAFIAATLVGTTSCNDMQKTGDGSTNADSAKSVIKSDTIKVSMDAQFLVKAAEINLEEIQLGQLAQQKATIADVKDLGKMMEEDHTKALSDLKELALKKSITIPATLDSNAQNDYKELSNLSGNDFDKEYCDMMVNGHKGAIALFEKETTDAEDTDIRQMATTTLPTLQKHFDHAVACQKECGKM